MKCIDEMQWNAMKLRKQVYWDRILDQYQPSSWYLSNCKDCHHQKDDGYIKLQTSTSPKGWWLCNNDKDSHHQKDDGRTNNWQRSSTPKGWHENLVVLWVGIHENQLAITWVPINQAINVWQRIWVFREGNI